MCDECVSEVSNAHTGFCLSALPLWPLHHPTLSGLKDDLEGAPGAKTMTHGAFLSPLYPPLTDHTVKITQRKLKVNPVLILHNDDFIAGF